MRFFAQCVTKGGQEVYLSVKVRDADVVPDMESFVSEKVHDNYKNVAYVLDVHTAAAMAVLRHERAPSLMATSVLM